MFVFIISSFYISFNYLLPYFQNYFEGSSISCFLSSIRRIFPEIVFGSSSTNSILRGYLYGAVNSLTCCWSTGINVSSFLSIFSLNTINAFTTLPRISSGLATTAHSLTYGCFTSASSTSNGPIV